MDKNTVININAVAEKKEMTLEEKLEKFKDRSTVFCVATQGAWDKLMEVLRKQGYKRVPWLYYINWSSYEKQSTVQRWNGAELYLGSINMCHPAAHCFIDITEDDFKPKEATAQQVAKVVLESAKKRAGEKNPLDAMRGGVEKVTFVGTHGDSRTFYVKTSKEGDAYIIREVAIPKFIKGEKFTDENGVLGRIDDIHNHTYDCEMVTGEKYALRIDEADKKFKKITW